MEYAQNPHKPKNHLKIIVLAIFIGILIFLLYTSYNPNLTITGKTISEKTTTSEKTSENQDIITIDASLTSPQNLKINTQIGKIKLKISGPANLQVGNQKIELSDKTSIILDNFQGKLYLNSKNITKLNGKSSKIFINGIPMSSKSKINLDENTPYSFLELNDFHLNSLSYKTSGKINLNNNKIIINLENEDFEIEDFYGNLEIKKENLRLKGQIQKSSIPNLIDSK